VLAKPALPVIARETVTGDPPAETLTLGAPALSVKVGAGGGVLLLALLLLEPEPPHPRTNKVQKRTTDTKKLQVEQWGRIVWPLQDRACWGGTVSISQGAKPTVGNYGVRASRSAIFV
jgi:hypothetical protein